MRALIWILLGGLLSLMGTFEAWECNCSHAECEWCADEEQEWTAYFVDAYCEYADEFTALFNSYEVKRAKNGTLMIRTGNSGSFKFAKKGN